MPKQKPVDEEEDPYVKERLYAQYRTISESMAAKRKPKNQTSADNDYDPHKW